MKKVFQVTILMIVFISMTSFFGFSQKIEALLIKEGEDVYAVVAMAETLPMAAKEYKLLILKDSNCISVEPLYGKSYSKGLTTVSPHSNLFLHKKEYSFFLVPLTKKEKISGVLKE